MCHNCSLEPPTNSSSAEAHEMELIVAIVGIDALRRSGSESMPLTDGSVSFVLPLVVESASADVKTPCFGPRASHFSFPSPRGSNMYTVVELLAAMRPENSSMATACKGSQSRWMVWSMEYRLVVMTIALHETYAVTRMPFQYAVLIACRPEWGRPGKIGRI